MPPGAARHPHSWATYIMVVVGKHFTCLLLLLWFSEKSPLNCLKNMFCSNVLALCGALCVAYYATRLRHASGSLLAHWPAPDRRAPPPRARGLRNFAARGLRQGSLPGGPYAVAGGRRARRRRRRQRQHGGGANAGLRRGLGAEKG